MTIDMAEQLKPGTSQANVLPFAKRKSVPIEPDLKKFLDECVIPMLIREAVAEISLERMPDVAPHSKHATDSGKAGVR